MFSYFQISCKEAHEVLLLSSCACRNFLIKQENRKYNTEFIPPQGPYITLMYILMVRTFLLVEELKKWCWMDGWKVVT